MSRAARSGPPAGPPPGSPPGALAFAVPAPPGGIAVTHPTRAGLLADLEARLARPEAGRGFRLATLNLDHLVKLRADAAFAAAYAAQTHVVADGNPVVWLHRLAGRGDVELVPGSELVSPLCAIAARTGAPVALVGSTDAVLEAAAARLEADHPGLRVALRHAPAMGFDPEGAPAEAAVARLAETTAACGRAGLCLLALGAPRQERFAAFAAPRLPGWGFASVGAGVDFVAGHQTRAPVWVRRLAMEWLWRLGGNPRRLGARYAACAAILPGLARRARAARRAA